MLMLSYIKIKCLSFIHAMDELFISEMKKKVSYQLVSFKLLQMSSLLSQIRNFPNFCLTLFSIGIEMISKIDFSKLITDTRKATYQHFKVEHRHTDTQTHTHTHTDTHTLSFIYIDILCNVVKISSNLEKTAIFPRFF